MVLTSELKRRQKISQALKGRKTWNTGLTRKDDPRIEKLAYWRGKQNLKKRTGLYKKCLKCEKNFYCPLALHKAGWGNYCCRKCGNLARGAGLRGKHLSDKQKQFLSRLKKGKPLHPKVLEGYKKKYPKGSRKGKLSAHWKGGITPINKIQREEFREFMQPKVFKKDNYRCVICGQGYDLQVDHKKSWTKYPKLRFDIDNCRTLCKNCHYEITFGRPIPDKNMLWGRNFNKGS